MESLKGKIIHVVIQGDAKTKTFYALILNPEHTVKYGQTGKVERLNALVANIERMAKKDGVKEIVWDPKLRMR
jgi:hypothetical protein